jgi:putative membrane protein
MRHINPRAMSRNFKEYAALVIQGVMMGAADVIPGVSGGTIAFITGIYEELIASIKGIHPRLITTLRKEGFGAMWREANASFLVAVFGGIGIALFSLAHLISYLLTHHATPLWSFFFGLILASTWVVGRKIGHWDVLRVVQLVAGALFAGWIVTALPAQTPDAPWFIFLSGAVAISAMILPGISGSFILLLLSKYEYIIDAIKGFDAATLALFGTGCVSGLAAFSRLLDWLFKRAHDATVAVLTGFMAGSLLKIWPFKVVLETRINSHGEVVPVVERPVWPDLSQDSGVLLGALGLAAMGLAIILILDRWNPEKHEN